MIGGPLLPCSTCGEWAGDGALCSACGATRSGQEPVRLDQSPGDERWVVSRRGSPERVAAALEALVPNAPDPAAARERVAAARRVLSALRGAHDVEVGLDLRRAEAGHLSKSKRRGSNEEHYWFLPWLSVQVRSGAPAPLEGWIVQVAHVRRRRSFGSAGVEDAATRFTMNELRLAHPSRGRLRRPFRSPTRLAVDLADLDVAVPPWEPPPATAPRSAHAEGAPLLAGGVLSAALAALLVVLLLTSGPPPPELPGDWRSLQAALTSGTPTAAVVRIGLTDAGADRRREALLAATDILPPAERRRALRAASQDPDPRVQALALELAARSGEMGSGLLAWVVAGAHAGDTERRLQALRLLVDRSDPRVVPLAVRGLQAGDAPLPLRRAWIQALGAVAQPNAAARAALVRGLGDADPTLRAQAGWALLSVAPREAANALVVALARTAQEVRSPDATTDHARALLTLARAADAAAPARAREVLERLLREPTLPRRLARRLRRLLQAPAADDR